MTRERYSSRSYAVTKSRRKKNQLMLTITLLLLMFVSVVSGGIFSYWAGSISAPTGPGTHTQSITVGTATGTVTTQVNVSEELASSGMKLVPVGLVASSVDGSTANVDSFVIDFEVNWAPTGGAGSLISPDDAIGGTLAIAATPTLTGTDTNSYGSLVNVNLDKTSSAITLNGSAVAVKATITLTEPGSKAAYEAIKGQNISVAFTFTVTMP